MKKHFLLLVALLTIYVGIGQNVQYLNYKAFFENKTMRIDYYHSGDADEEHFSVDRILNDGPWAGSKNKVLDDLKLGLYFLQN